MQHVGGGSYGFKGRVKIGYGWLEPLDRHIDTRREHLQRVSTSNQVI